MSDAPNFIFGEYKPFAVNFHDVKEVEAYDRKQGTTEADFHRKILPDPGDYCFVRRR